MAALVTCPTCGHQLALPDGSAGRLLTCPRCQSPFRAAGNEPIPTAAPLTPPAPLPSPSPLNKTMLAPLDPPIRYSCPRCQKPLEDPASEAGTKKPCPGCGQRIQVPAPPPPGSAPPGLNKTMLAQEPPPAPARREERREERRDERPREAPKQERCLECGRDVTHFEDVFRCRDCGALFCSAACNRDHRRHAHERRRERVPLGPPPDPGADNTGLIVGLTVGGVFFIVVLFLVFFLAAVRW